MCQHSAAIESYAETCFAKKPVHQDFMESFVCSCGINAISEPRDKVLGRHLLQKPSFLSKQLALIYFRVYMWLYVYSQWIHICINDYNQKGRVAMDALERHWSPSFLRAVTFTRTSEPADHDPVHNRFGALLGTHLYHLWMHARFYDCEKSTWFAWMWWFIVMHGQWSGRKDMADPMLSPRKVPRSRPLVPLITSKRKLRWKTETAVQKPGIDPMHRE